MTIPREAVEAAALSYWGRERAGAPRWDSPKVHDLIRQQVRTAVTEDLTAALPHLAPKSTESDEDRAEEIARAFTPVDMGGTVKARTERILAFVSAVRAEERAAQATQIAALREAVFAARYYITETADQYGYDASDEPVIAVLRVALEMSGGAK